MKTVINTPKPALFRILGCVYQVIGYSIKCVLVYKQKLFGVT